MRDAILSLLTCLTLALPARADDTLVFAAVSLAGPLDTVAELYEAATGREVTISYGASSVLARQVAAGAPAEVVILANAAWMDELEGADLLAPGTRRDLLGNRLVLIGGPGARDTTLTDLPAVIGSDRLALGLTEAVPVGLYARAALENLGLWEPLRPHVAETDNARVVLALVAQGAARYGVVYATDARVEPRVRVLDEIATDLHPPIRYPLAVVNGAGSEAMEFAAFLGGPAATEVFAAAGYGDAPE